MKDKLSLLLVENAGSSNELIRDFIDTRDDIILSGRVNTGSEARNILKNREFDILCMEFSHPGITAVHLIDGIELSSQIILIADSDKYAVRAFEMGAADYIVKPVDTHRLNIVFDRAVARVRQQRKNRPVTDQAGIAVKEGRKIYMIRYGTIISLHANDNNTIVNTGEGSFTSDKYLGYFEKNLPDNFYRIHKRFIINIDFLVYIKPQAGGRYTAALSGGESPELPVGRKYAEGLKKILGI